MRAVLPRIGRALCALAAGLAAAGSALAAVPAPAGWKADPDDQFLLDVTVRQQRLGDGVRAYATPEGTCVIFGDFLAALDVPVTIDLASRVASGWAFREEHRIVIDAAAGRARFGQRQEAIAPGILRETPEGWCVDSQALARWFAIGVQPLTSGSALLIESEAKLPVELAYERRLRAEQLKPARFDLSTLPQVKLPYRLWRAPALDFIVSGGATYRADSGVRVDRRTSILAAGEIARLSYDAQLSTNDRGRPSSLRLRAFRSDPDGGLLGPLKATHIGFGDVLGLGSRLGGTGASGRGAVVTNRPLFNPTDFDRTRFEGDLPAGWEAELYRNGELLAFSRPTADQRYVFEDVQLFYGENRISIVLYGPQGQVRSRDELINVGQDNVPPGKTWYWAGFNQPGRDLVAFRTPADVLTQPKIQAAIALEHGIDTKTSVGALARAMLIDDERVTFVEGSLRRAIGSALAEVAVARDSKGGTAARAQLIARTGSVNISAEALAARDFYLHGARQQTLRQAKIAVDAPIRLGKTVLPAHADVKYTAYGDGSRYLEAAARLSATIDRFNLATDLRYRRQLLAHGPSPPGEVDAEMIAAGRIGPVRVRGSLLGGIAPDPRFRSAEISGYWSASDRVDWEAGVAYDAFAKRARARVTHVRRFNALAVALTGEAATDGSLAVGFNLNFSLDSAKGFNLSRQPLAAAGVVHATVYRDLNDNGVRDPSEPPEPGALLTAGTRTVDKATDKRGAVLLGGLAAFTPITVGVDLSSLADPMLVPKKALQVVTPRPGVAAEVEIGLVGGGDIEGVIVKNGGMGFEGLDLELIDAGGAVVATARTDFDGFFLFERVAFGSYRLRVAKDSAVAANIHRALDAQVTVEESSPVVRLGSIAVTALPEMALQETPAAAGP